MRNVVKMGVAGLALLGLTGTPAWTQGVKSVGSQPTRDELIEQLVPHGGVVSPDERGLRVRAANPTDAGADANDSPAPAVALDVKFALNSAALTDEAKDTIRRLAAAINSDQLAGYRFRVAGHTDATGRPDYNMALSKRRAEAVRAYLVSDLGVAAKRLQVVGRGQEEPLDPTNPTSSVNRRVQVENLGH